MGRDFVVDVVAVAKRPGDKRGQFLTLGTNFLVLIHLSKSIYCKFRCPLKKNHDLVGILFFFSFFCSFFFVFKSCANGHVTICMTCLPFGNPTHCYDVLNFSICAYTTQLVYCPLFLRMRMRMGERARESRRSIQVYSK